MKCGSSPDVHLRSYPCLRESGQFLHFLFFLALESRSEVPQIVLTMALAAKGASWDNPIEKWAMNAVPRN